MNIQPKPLYNTLFYINIASIFYFIIFSIGQISSFYREYYINIPSLIPSIETQSSGFSLTRIILFSCFLLILNIIIWRKRDFITVGKYFYITLILTIISMPISKYIENTQYLIMLFFSFSLYLYIKMKI